MTHTHSGKPIKLVVVLADLHFGSTKALLPPGFTTLEGNGIELNAMQDWLWECWGRAEDFMSSVVGKDRFALVINGDLIEGVHHGTKEIWSPEIGDHAKAAVECLEPLSAKAAVGFVIRGTECHVNNHEQAIAKALGCVLNKETGIHAFDRLTLDVNGVRHVFRHHIGSTIRRGLAGTQLSVNLAEEQLEAVNNGEPLPNVVCVAHRHKYGVYKDDNGMVVVSPPWQGLTRFGHKVVSQARTKPGVYILDHRNKQPGELPDVKVRLFDTPQPDAYQL